MSEIVIKAESEQHPDGKWFASVEWEEPSGELRRFVSPDVETEAEADALAYGAAQDVLRQIKEMDSSSRVTHEEWNGRQMGHA